MWAIIYSFDEENQIVFAIDENHEVYHTHAERLTDWFSIGSKVIVLNWTKDGEEKEILKKVDTQQLFKLMMDTDLNEFAKIVGFHTLGKRVYAIKVILDFMKSEKIKG